MQCPPELTRLKGRDGGLTLRLHSYQPRVLCDTSQEGRTDARNLDTLYELVPTSEDKIVFGRSRDAEIVHVEVWLPKKLGGNFLFPKQSCLAHSWSTVPGFGGITATLRLNTLPTILTSWYDIYCTIVAIGTMCVDRYNTGGYAHLSQMLQSRGLSVNWQRRLMRALDLPGSPGYMAIDIHGSNWYRGAGE